MGVPAAVRASPARATAVGGPARASRRPGPRPRSAAPRPGERTAGLGRRRHARPVGAGRTAQAGRLRRRGRRPAWPRRHRHRGPHPAGPGGDAARPAVRAALGARLVGPARLLPRRRVLGSLGSPDSRAALAAESGLRLLSVDYRLAPEHPYPAGWTTRSRATAGPGNARSSWVRTRTDRDRRR